MIQVKGLTFTYPGNGNQTIRGLDFFIEPGEIFGFLGPSGAGKSTTQKILIGILKGYGGSVLVMDQEIKSVTADYYEGIGVAFEFPNFYSRFTAKENLNLFRGLYAGDTEEPDSLLAMVGLEKYGAVRVSDFSKGMKMRLNFCRALLNKPDILFLDEPTSGLDPVNAKNIKEIIRNLKSVGKTILLTTHNMSVAEELCDRVAFIVDGRIELIDSPRELKIKRGKKVIRVEYKEGEAVNTIEFPMKGIGDNTRFINLLKSGAVDTAHTLEASLEDIFIEVTGRKLV